jgi:hypothetical protein
MRYFNTSGPCNPAEHYTVLRRELVAEGMEKVRRGRYVTIFAPRQSGKTTFFKLLIGELWRIGEYKPIWVSFENLKNATKEQFYETFSHELNRELEKIGVSPPHAIKNEIDLALFFEKLRHDCPNLVVVIDEFEGVPDAVLGDLMHTFRKIYHGKGIYALHSLMLVGVSTIADLIVSSASPFNIVDEQKIPYFSKEEVKDLVRQYTAESGQTFEDEVIRAIYANTAGQPGLVCALCAHLVESVATDRSQPVTMVDFYKTLTHFLTERFDKNIINIIRKAREKQAFMLRLLFTDEPIPFTVHDPDIGYLYAHGVVENINGAADVPVPLYKKSLLSAFRPAINGETGYYVSAKDNFSTYEQPEGLNLNAILQQYVAYIAKRGYRAFDTKHLKEGAWHYSLDGFINFFIERLGGQTYTEVPTGRGRTDILIIYRDKKYIIETKIFTDLSYFEKGKRQLAAYLTTENLTEGYYVVFSRRHSKDDILEQEEMIDGKRIFTRLIRVNLDRPSKRKKRKKSSLRKT